MLLWGYRVCKAIPEKLIYIIKSCFCISLALLKILDHYRPLRLRWVLNKLYLSFYPRQLLVHNVPSIHKLDSWRSWLKNNFKIPSKNDIRRFQNFYNSGVLLKKVVVIGLAVLRFEPFDQVLLSLKIPFFYYFVSLLIDN